MANKFIELLKAIKKDQLVMGKTDTSKMLDSYIDLSDAAISLNHIGIGNDIMYDFYIKMFENLKETNCANLELYIDFLDTLDHGYTLAVESKDWIWEGIK